MKFFALFLAALVLFAGVEAHAATAAVTTAVTHAHSSGLLGHLKLIVPFLVLGMAAQVTNSNIPSTLKPTLDNVWGDQNITKPYWKDCGFKVSNSTDAYEDDQEFAHTGIMPAKLQGALIAIDNIQQGFSKRYTHVTYALRMIVSEEALADCKYDEAIAGAKSIGRSGILTQEFQAASVFINAFNSSFVGGDTVSLCSTAHPLPKGGTTGQNMFTNAMSLSETAVETMSANMRQIPGSNGYVQAGYMLKKLVVPVQLWFRACRILKSEQQNDTNNNAVNVLKGMGIEIAQNAYFTSTTNWFGVSDLDAGLRFIWRQKPMFRTENTTSNYTAEYSGIQRFSVGFTDWRDVYGSNI